MEFKEYVLEEVLEKIFSGGTPHTQKKEYWNGNIPWLSSGETRNRIIKHTEKFISDEGVSNSSTKQALKGDIVIASAGQGLTRGQTSLLEIDTYINQSIISLRVNDKLVDNKYLYYNISNRYDELRAISDSASIRGSLTTAILKKIKVKLPSLEIQRKIASILWGIDSKIELNKEIIKNLEDITSSIFKNWFIDFEFPNEQGLPYRSSGGEMIESELGEIPKGWSFYNLGDFAESISKSIKKKEVEYARFLNTSDIDQGKIEKVDLTLTSEMPGQAKKLIKKGDILYSEIRPKNKRYAFVDFDSNEYVVSTKLMVIRVNEKVYSNKLLYVWLTQEDTINTLQQIAEDRSGTFPQITFSILSNFKFVLPNRDKLKEFEEVLTPFLDKILVLQRENEKLSILRDTLLPKLLSGEIEIPDESVVEPS